MINIEKELEKVKTRKKELADIGYNSVNLPRKSYFGNLVLEADLEEFKTLDKMESMLKHNTSDTLNEELYNKYKSELPSTKDFNNEVLEGQELDIENLVSEVSYEPETPVDNKENSNELDIENLDSEITYEPETNENNKDKTEELDIENLDSEVTYEPEKIIDNKTEPKELDIENLDSEITYEPQISAENKEASEELDIENLESEITYEPNSNDINWDEELTKIKNRKNELSLIALNAPASTEKKRYYNDIVRKVDFEEYLALNEMETMIKHSTEIDIDRYNEQKEKTKIDRIDTQKIDIDTELKIVNMRMQEIIRNKQTATGDKKIVIASGDPVLDSDAPEYNKLKRMKYILTHDMINTNEQEYLSLKKEINTPKTSEENPLETINRGAIINDEKHKIERRMKELEDAGVLVDISEETIEVGERKNVLASDYTEYQNLQTLKNIIDHNFQTANADDYNDIRSKTSLGRMNDNEINQMKNLEQPITNPVPEKNNNNANFENDNPIDVQNPQDNLRTDNPLENDNTITNPDDELIEVTGNKAWNWIKDHKKQILIAVGITVLGATVAIMLANLMPALTAATKAAQIPNLISQMYANGSLWKAASPVGKEILHGGNAVLAQAISSLTGVSNTFNSVTGAWTFGTQSLASFNAMATANAVSASAGVGAISNTAIAFLLGGAGVLGLKQAIPKKTSPEYKDFKKGIDNIKMNAPHLSEEEIQHRAEMINNNILTSKTLTDIEKNLLFKKLNKTLKHANSMHEYDFLNERNLDFNSSKDTILARTNL